MGRERVENLKTREDMMRFIKWYWTAHKMAPSYREIMAACKIPSTSMINYHLGILEEENRIKFNHRVARSIRPTNMRIVFT
jgi:SOS-response transcriptional repressor LexA